MNTKWVVSTVVAPIYRDPIFSSEMVTQGLIWEEVSILKQYNNWSQIKMEDQYFGWIHQFYLMEIQKNIENKVLITDRYAEVYAKFGNTDLVSSILSFGSKIPLLDKTSEYSKILLNCETVGYISKQRDIRIQNRIDLIKLASSLRGAPYLWGGKSSFGFDCSGFVQMVFKTAGILFPRDTSKQINFEKLKKIDKQNAHQGDLIFFSENSITNHVAFVVGEGKILHCSGEVKFESIIEGKSDFNKKLSDLDHTYLSISNLFDF